MKKKRNLIIISIFSIITSFVILYLKTDLFKTKEILFWKYMLSQKDEICHTLSNDEIKNYNNNIKNSSYIKEGNILVESKNNFIKPINIKLEEKGNNKEDCVNTYFELLYDKNNVGNLLIIKDDNYYILNSSVLDSKYIGFENANLKEFASKIGITNTKYIPNKIKNINYSELFIIEEYEKKHIMKQYIPIYRKFVKNKSYDIEKNARIDDNKNEVDAYKISLTDKQLNEFLAEALDVLYEDNITLEFISKKIKIINNESELCDISKLKDKIKEISNKIRQKQTKNETIISIIIYKKEKNVIKTELIIEDNRTISIECVDNENKIIIRQYDVNNMDADINTIEGIIRFIINSITEITYSKDIINNDSRKVNFNIICNLGIERITLNYNYVEQIKNNVEDIMYKNDVEFIDLKKINKKQLDKIIDKVLKIKGLEDGKKY